MSGEELKKKLDAAGISQAEISRKLGVIPQSVNQSLAAKDVKSGFIESLCRAFELDAGFFYGGAALPDAEHNKKIRIFEEKVSLLQQENEKLKEEITRMNDPELPKKESEVYRLWMEHMKITERMQELYQIEKEG
jgi:transcriptional regulator with XRE-family HTH domain